MRHLPHLLPTSAEPHAAQHDSPDDREPARAGDKVRMKNGPHAGARGVIRSARGDRLRVRLPDGASVVVIASDITNYSAAARLAWKRMPKRAGRPLALERKVRVSLRIDSGTWTALAVHAARGHIRSREHLTNVLLHRALQRLDAGADAVNRQRPSRRTVVRSVP